jgi:nicotinamide-nucleotide amidase
MKNEHGTAPGLWMEKDDTVFVSMPGVPYEMKYLMRNEVLPRVARAFQRPFIYHKTLLTYGLGESTIADRISNFEDQLPHDVKLAYLPSLGRVRLRLLSRGSDEHAIREKVDSLMDQLHGLLSDIAVGYENETTIQEQIGGLLVQKQQRLSLAESCTGGAIAREITAIAGASNYFSGSVTPYQTVQKERLLGVDSELIKEYSVVSRQVAEAMAIRCLKLFDTDWAVATTGNAGPDKGDADAEIGTVFIAVANRNAVVVEEFNFGKARERVITKATNKAFEMLLREISKN